MPRKTKELVIQNDKVINDEEEKKLAKKSSKTTSEKKASKSTKSSESKKYSELTTKKTTTKKAEKNSEKAVAKKNTEKKTSATKNSKTTKTSKSKNNTQEKAKTTRKKAKKAETNYIVEYYDLPYRYNQTIVKLLAQTPNSLFVYWDISDSDRENYVKKYGEDFFYITKPVLKIHNDTLNYDFEIEIDDFANGWYIHVNDADCKYRIDLARRPKYYNSKIQDNYIYITSSNKIDAPNDHILFEKITPDFRFKFRNVKNNQVNYKNISNILNSKNVIFKNTFINIQQLYNLIYEKQNIEELNTLSNPSSNFSSRN